MKYLKVIVATAIAAAALMAIASPASATEITITNGGATETVGAGAEISSELEAGTEATLKSSFIGEVKCSESSVVGEVTNGGSSTETVKGNISTLTFTSCNGTVTVVKKGTLEVHTEGTSANGNGTLTSNGAEVTVELAGLHCIYSTSNTDIGQWTGTHTGHVILHVWNTIPRTGGRSGAFCGSSANWTATYTVLALWWRNIHVTNFTVD